MARKIVRTRHRNDSECRFLSIVLLIALVPTMLMTFPTTAAKAHGSCDLFAGNIYKKDGYIFADGNRYTCASTHYEPYLRIVMQKRRSGEWVTETWFVREGPHDGRTVTANDVRMIECSSGKWRSRVQGFAYNATGWLAHANGPISGDADTYAC